MHAMVACWQHGHDALHQESDRTAAPPPFDRGVQHIGLTHEHLYDGPAPGSPRREVFGAHNCDGKNGYIGPRSQEDGAGVRGLCRGIGTAMTLRKDEDYLTGLKQLLG